MRIDSSQTLEKYSTVIEGVGRENEVSLNNGSWCILSQRGGSGRLSRGGWWTKRCNEYSVRREDGREDWREELQKREEVEKEKQLSGKEAKRRAIVDRLPAY